MKSSSASYRSPLCAGRIAIALTVLSSTGCGVLAQSVVGWNEETRTPFEEHRTVRVRANHSDAEIYRRESDGSLTHLGIGSAQDELVLQRERIDTEANYVAAMIGGACTLAGTIGAIAVLSHASGDEAGPSETALYLSPLLAVGLFELIGIPLLARDSEQTRVRTPNNGGVRTYVVKRAGKSAERRIDASVTSHLTLFSDGRPAKVQAHDPVAKASVPSN